MIRSTLTSLLAVGLLTSTAAAQFFSPGNVVVLRVGDPSITLGSTAAPIFLEEWDTNTNTLVQTVAIPNSSTSAVPSVTQRGFSSSEGNLTLSADGRYLILTGYDRMVGATDPSAEPAVSTNRVICTVDTLTGIIDTSTALTDAFDASTLRGATSVDGSSFWLSGNSGSGSVRYATLGATTSTDVLGSPTNMRWIDTHKGQLYATCASTAASAQGVMEVGTGLPTAPGQMATLLPGFPANGVFSDGAPYDFWWADDTTLYVADSAFTGSNCGVQKWTLAGGTWTRQYTIVVGATECIRGLSGVVRNGVPEIWFTAEPSGFVTSLYKVVDTGPASTPTLINTESPQTDYRGVRVIRSFVSTANVGCGQSQLMMTGPGLIGTDLDLDMVNAAGFPFINFSFVGLGLPLSGCGCTIAYDLGALVGAASVTFSIPSNPAVIGTQLNVQGFDLFDPTSTCVSPVPGLPMTVTDGLSIFVY